MIPANIAALRLAVIQVLDTAVAQVELDDLPLYGDWSVQGFGVVRLFIRNIGRLHIWDDTLRYPDVSMVHTHSWDLRSTIVCGKLMNTRYHETIFGFAPRFPHKKQRLITGYNTQMVSPVVDVDLITENPEFYGPGDVYAQHAREIHRTDAVNGTVTIMERTEIENGEADVYWPAGCTWGTAKPRKATPDEVRTTALKAIALLVEK